MNNDCTMMVRDYRGIEIPEPLRSQSIKVWEFEPHQSYGYTSCIVMDWQSLHELLGNMLVEKLERMDEDELREGLDVKIRLIDMTYGDYLDSFDH